jgi:integrase
LTVSTAGGLVVVDELGQPIRPEWYSDRFRALIRQAGLPPITLHAVRHSLAFWLHREGVTPADAAALLGHTVAVHLSTYLPHSGASGIASAARALGRAAAAE